MKKRIYVPQLDKIFDSISDAAADLGINAANISKVLGGRRKQAGGYNFISAVTAAGKTRSRTSLRSEGRKLMPDPLAEERAELRRAIQSVNKQAKRLTKAGFGSFSAAMQDLLALGDEFGRTKAGYLKSSDNMLRQLNEAEIHKYLEAIEERKKRRSYSIGGAQAEAERLAGAWGTTSSRVAELSDSLPLIFAMLHSALPQKGGSDVIVSAMAEVFNSPSYDDEGNPVDDNERMIEALSELTDYIDTSEALEEMLKNDYFLLDKFQPVRGALEQLLEASHDPDFEGSEIVTDTIDSVSRMIINNWQMEGDELGDLIDILKDDIEGALNYLDIPYGGYTEDEIY